MRFRPVALSLVVAAGVGLFWKALFAGETFYVRDLRSFYRPAKALVSRLTAATGGLPLWNPLFASGQPFAANPEHAMFHPFTALFLLVPFEWAFRLQVILPPLCAGLSMYALGRTLRRSRWGALFGALSWALGGYMLSVTNLLPILLAMAALPAAVAFAVRVARGGRLVDVAGLGLCFALVCAAGEPATMMMMVPLVLAAVLAERRRRPLLVVAGVCLGTVMAAAVLLPGLHHAARTVRAAGLPADYAGTWALPPVRIAELLLPHVLGDVADRPGPFWGASLYPRTGFPYLSSLYPGLLATLLASFAWVARRRALWPWMALAGLGYGIALGPTLPLWPLLHRLPLFGGIRYPEKFALLVVFAVSIGAGHGFDQVAHAWWRRRLLRILMACAVVALLATAGVWLAAGSPFARWVPLRAAIVAIGGAAVLLSWRRWRNRTIGFALLCAVPVLDLVTAGRELVPTVPIADVAAPPAFMRPLASDSAGHVIFHLAQWNNGLRGVRDMAPPPIPAQWNVPMTLETDFDLTQLRWTNEATTLFWKAAESQPAIMNALMQRRGVTDVVILERGATRAGDRTLPPRGAPSAFSVVPMNDPRPLAFAVARVERVDGPDGWLQAVLRLRQEASVTACVDASGSPPFEGRPAAAQVVVGRRTPTRLELEVNAMGPGPSYVAINQTWDEGWRAALDGAPTRLHRTDVSLSGLVVPAGRHQVTLIYRDRWLDVGLLVSLGGILACVALAIAGRISARHG